MKLPHQIVVIFLATMPVSARLYQDSSVAYLGDIRIITLRIHIVLEGFIKNKI